MLMALTDKNQEQKKAATPQPGYTFQGVTTLKSSAEVTIKIYPSASGTVPSPVGFKK